MKVFKDSNTELKDKELLLEVVDSCTENEVTPNQRP